MVPGDRRLLEASPFSMDVGPYVKCSMSIYEIDDGVKVTLNVYTP